MKKLLDYPCKHKNDSGFSPGILSKTALPFPASYNDSVSLATLSQALKEEMKAPFCILPFCHTVEAEALGAIITLGDGHIGPRAKVYAFDKTEDILQIPSIDFSTGRIHQVLQACSLLKGRGEKVALEISGPFSILTCLIDISKFFITWRKQPQLVEEVFDFISCNLLSYYQAACEAGVDIISYADPVGSLAILGPQYSEITCNLFTVPFLQQAEVLVAGKCLIHLCPKTTLILTGLSRAEYQDFNIPENLTYAEAALHSIGKVSIIGQSCLKDTSHLLNSDKLRKICWQQD